MYFTVTQSHYCCLDFLKLDRSQLAHFFSLSQSTFSCKTLYAITVKTKLWTICSNCTLAHFFESVNHFHSPLRPHRTTEGNISAIASQHSF